MRASAAAPCGGGLAASTNAARARPPASATMQHTLSVLHTLRSSECVTLAMKRSASASSAATIHAPPVPCRLTGDAGLPRHGAELRDGRSRSAGDCERQAPIGEQRPSGGVRGRLDEADARLTGSPAVGSAGSSACATIARAVPSASEPIRNTTVLPVRSTPTASANTFGRPSNTNPTTPSGARLSLDAPPAVIDGRRRVDRGRQARSRPAAQSVDHARPTSSGVSSSRVVERPSAGGRARRRALAAVIAIRPTSASSSRSANSSKNREICASVHAASAANAATAASTAADATACSAAGTCSSAPVDGSTSSRSPGRKAAASIVHRRHDPVAAEHDRLPGVDAVSVGSTVPSTSSESIGSAHGDRAYARPMDSPNGAEPDDRLYFRQLLSGRDFAVDDPVAAQMVNFVYAIGDRATGECVLVDPAYDPSELVDTVARRRHARHGRARPPTTTPTTSAAA